MGGRRFALLVATDRYQDLGLSRLAAPSSDARNLAAVLRDAAIAGFEVTQLYNRPNAEVGRAIGNFYRDRRRDDLTLLYFTGHGIKDDYGQLYLAMTDTDRDNLQFTGVRGEHIRLAMEACRSRQNVLILDCCYAGAFPAGAGVKGDTAVHALEQFGGRGSVVLTSSDATQYSFEGNQLTESGPVSLRAGPSSLFTRFLVEGLRTGRADLDGDGDITLDELYSYVHDHVTRRQPQQRPKKKEDVEGRIIFARNIHWTLPLHIKSALSSPYAAAKLTALEELRGRYHGGNTIVQQRVLETVRELVEDDSKQVSGAASRFLSAVTEAEDKARQKVEDKARQEAEDKARQEVIDSGAETHSQVGEAAISTPAPEQGPGEEAPQADELRETPGRAPYDPSPRAIPAAGHSPPQTAGPARPGTADVAMPAGAAAASTIGSAPGEADTQTGDTEPPASAAATGPSRTGARAGDRGKADWSAAQGAEGSIPPTTGATVVLPTEPGTTSKPEMTTGETGTVAEEPDITADKADTSAVNVSFLPLAAIVAALARLRRIPVRRPLLTSALAVLAILVVGGIFAGWRYTQARYYVGEEAGHVAIFRGINQNVAGLNLSSVYQRTEIPLAAVPVTDQGAIRSTISATSLAGAQSIVGNIRSDYQTCQAAFAALNTYQAKMHDYTTALNAYKRKHHTTRPVTDAGGNVVAVPPAKPAGAAPIVPAECPAPVH
jgi:hypothetical protein